MRKSDENKNARKWEGLMLMEKTHRVEELFFEIEINTLSTEDGVCVYSCVRAFRINFLLVLYKKICCCWCFSVHYDAI